MMATKKPARKKPLDRQTIISLALTEGDKKAVESIAQEGSDWTGQAVSVSALLRGLIRHAKGQSPSWLREAVFTHLEAEIGLNPTLLS